MVKKTLLASVALTLMAFSALAVPPMPQAPSDGFISQTEIPVCIVIDKYAYISVLEDCILLHEKAGNWWEGSTMVTIINNWSVVVTATIEPYEPNIEAPLPSAFMRFVCLIEGDPAGFGLISTINLHPYPEGYNFRLWAGIQSPNLLARASSTEPQRVATIYLTVQN